MREKKRGLQKEWDRKGGRKGGCSKDRWKGESGIQKENEGTKKRARVELERTKGKEGFLGWWLERKIQRNEKRFSRKEDIQRTPKRRKRGGYSFIRGSKL